MGYLKLYVILLKRAKPRLADALRLLADPANLPLMVHCIHGARRWPAGVARGGTRSAGGCSMGMSLLGGVQVHECCRPCCWLLRRMLRVGLPLHHVVLSPAVVQARTARAWWPCCCCCCAAWTARWAATGPPEPPRLLARTWGHRPTPFPPCLLLRAMCGTCPSIHTRARTHTDRCRPRRLWCATMLCPRRCCWRGGRSASCWACLSTSPRTRWGAGGAQVGGVGQDGACACDKGLHAWPSVATPDSLCGQGPPHPRPAPRRARRSSRLRLR